MGRSDLNRIVGKTISKVIVAEGPQTPKYQLFLLFDDGTYFEMYGESPMLFSGDSYKGGEQEVLRCVRNEVVE